MTDGIIQKVFRKYWKNAKENNHALAELEQCEYELIAEIRKNLYFMTFEGEKGAILSITGYRLIGDLDK